MEIQRQGEKTEERMRERTEREQGGAEERERERERDVKKKCWIEL